MQATSDFTRQAIVPFCFIFEQMNNCMFFEKYISILQEILSSCAAELELNQIEVNPFFFC
jgi:hypothetical protein